MIMTNHKGISHTKTRQGNAETGGNPEIVTKEPPLEFFIQLKTYAIHDSRLSDSAFRTLCLLLDKVGKKPSQRILQAKLAECLGVTPRTLRRRLSELVEAGYVGTYRTGRSNGYFLDSALVVVKEDKSVRSDRTKVSALQSNNSFSNNSGVSELGESPKSGRETAAAEGSPDLNKEQDKRFKEWLKNSLKPLNAYFSELGEEGIHQLNATTEKHRPALEALEKAWTLGDSSASVGEKLLNAYKAAEPKTQIKTPSGFTINSIPSWLASTIAAKPQAIKAEWCGKCDRPEYRFLTNELGQDYPCPECHPGSLKGTSLKPQETLTESKGLKEALEELLKENSLSLTK